MKLDLPKNSNYCATVVSLPKARVALDGLDNLEGVSIYGYQVLVSKDSEGMGIFFPAETQLSDKFLYENNLYREDSRTGNLNKDKGVKGFFDKNGRVRAIKFKGNVSNGFFIPLTSLIWTGINIDMLAEGDEFDTIGGHEICRKYEVFKKTSNTRATVDRGFVRTDKKFMPEHIDTEHFFRNFHKIDPDETVYITQKLHGTSIRIANTMVNHKLTLVERIARLLGAKIIEHEYTYLYGSRKVIKDANNPNQVHFYEQDIWTEEGRKLDGMIPENYILYGELIGWTKDGSPLQKGYTYNQPKGTCALYIYRITVVNSKGLTTDLSWKQVKEFCTNNGLKYVPELKECKMSDLTKDRCYYITSLMDKRYSQLFTNAVPLGENELVDEGVCVRADGLTPKILKAKSPLFLEHETKMLDTGEEDLESSQNINE